MIVSWLIEKLKQLPQDAEVMCRDCVAYRDMTGPYTQTITEQDADDHGDCEGRVGEEIVVI